MSGVWLIIIQIRKHFHLLQIMLNNFISHWDIFLSNDLLLAECSKSSLMLKWNFSIRELENTKVILSFRIRIFILLYSFRKGKKIIIKYILFEIITNKLSYGVLNSWFGIFSFGVHKIENGNINFFTLLCI